jgi:hypothetical protein
MSIKDSALLMSDSSQRPPSAFSLRRVQIFFIAALAGALFSKLGTLLPGFAPDDYFFAFDSKITMAGVALGRPLSDALTYGMNWLGLTYTSVQVPAFFLSSVALSAFIAIVLNATLREKSPVSIGACAAAFAAAHPYLSSYYLFRVTMLGLALVFAILCVAFVLFINRRLGLWSRAGSCSVLLAAACSINPLAFFLFLVCALAWSMQEAIDRYQASAKLANVAGPFVFLAATIATTLILYLLLGAAARHLLHVAAVTEYTPEIKNGIAGLVSTELGLSWGIVFGTETLLPATLKWLAIGLLAYACIKAFVHDWAWGFAALALFVTGILVSASPMAVSWGYHVPRVFSTVGFVFALSIALAANGMGGGKHRIYQGGLIFCICVFCMLSGTMFFQNAQLARWDQQQAANIYFQAVSSGLLVPGRTLRISGGWPFYQQRISIAGAGINESAFSYQWEYKDLFAVSAGALVDVAAGDKSLCINKPKWPQPGSMFLSAPSSVYVCL